MDLFLLHIFQPHALLALISLFLNLLIPLVSMIVAALAIGSIKVGRTRWVLEKKTNKCLEFKSYKVREGPSVPIIVVISCSNVNVVPGGWQPGPENEMRRIRTGWRLTATSVLVFGAPGSLTGEAQGPLSSPIVSRTQLLFRSSDEILELDNSYCLAQIF